MRVLITNSLVLAAISLAPAVSAAPYSTSSVDSYSNVTAATVSQEPSVSPTPNVRRDQVIHLQSLYDGSPFGSIFGPVADMFGTIGMNTISDSIPLTEAQKSILGQLHDALSDAAGSVIANLPASNPLSPLASRDLEERQAVNPLAILANLPNLGSSLTPVSDLLASIGIGPNPTLPLTEVQKQVIARLQTAIGHAVGDVAANAPLNVLPIGQHPRSVGSVEGRSLDDILSIVNQVPVLSNVLSPVTGLINSLGVTNGGPLDDVQKQVLTKLQAAVSQVVQNVESHAASIHILDGRGEDWDHDHGHHHADHAHKDGDRHDWPAKHDERLRPVDHNHGHDHDWHRNDRWDDHHHHWHGRQEEEENSEKEKEGEDTKCMEDKTNVTAAEKQEQDMDAEKDEGSYV